jgi:glycosyltransferase involved in cell wall biosynthesis
VRIAVIGPLTMPNPHGGMSRHCEEIYSRLADEGHDVTVYCRDRPRGPVHRGMRLRRVPGIRRRPWDRLIYSFLASLRASMGKYDVVHYHSFASCAFSFLPKIARKRVVVTIHRFEWRDEKWGMLEREFLRYCEWAATRCSDERISVSRHFADDVAARYPGLKPAHVIFNGVTSPPAAGLETLRPLGLEPGRYLLTVGRLVPEKGIDVALAAFERLVESGDEDGFVVAVVGGSREIDDYVHALAARAAEMAQNVRMLGVQSGSVLTALYQHARALVAPSYDEGQPLTVLEAMHEGLCVVASDIPGHRELLDGAAILVPPGDVAGFAEAMRIVIRDAACAAALGRRAQETVSGDGRYRWDTAAASTERVLESVCTGRADAVAAPARTEPSETEDADAEDAEPMTRAG